MSAATPSSLLYTLRGLVRGQAGRAVAVLVSGTALSHGLTIAAGPLLTRMFEPADFGAVAVLLSSAMIVSSIASGRYELAVVLPESDEEAADLFVLSARLAVFVSLGLLVPCLIWSTEIAGLLGNASLGPWLFLLPILSLSLTLLAVFQYWCNRFSLYDQMAKDRFKNAVANVGGSVLLGLFRAPAGLMVGKVVGHLLAAIWIGTRILVSHRSLLRGSTKEGRRKMARRYRNHPLHIAPAQMLGTVGGQLPMLVMSTLFSPAVAGLFSMAVRMISAPTTLVANAIGDVFRQKISVAYNQRGEFRREFLLTLGSSAALAVIPCSVLAICSPELFSLLFGEEWRPAGEFAQIMSIGAFFRFTFSPLDKCAVVVGATHFILLWQGLKLVLTILQLAAMWYYDLSFEYFVWSYVGINSFLYLLDGAVCYGYACGRFRGKRVPAGGVPEN